MNFLFAYLFIDIDLFYKKKIMSMKTSIENLIISKKYSLLLEMHLIMIELFIQYFFIYHLFRTIIRRIISILIILKSNQLL